MVSLCKALAFKGKHMPYSIQEHKHRFAAWAASRAANVKGCRFTVEQGKQILEDAGLNVIAESTDNLPHPKDFDTQHRKWRDSVKEAAEKHSDKNDRILKFKDGIAAKLINIYSKSIFVCSGSHEHPKVKAIHPPIDSGLLDELYNKDIGNKRKEWQAARKVRWSKLDSGQYEKLISAIKEVLPNNAGLWEIEEYWRGYQ